MRSLHFILFFSLCAHFIWAQKTDQQQLLYGQVLYRNVPVPNQNVINSTAQTATITNNGGQFAIEVKVGDEIVFTAVNYQIMMVKITTEILKRNRLVVEVNEKITELDEVVVTPENKEKFLLANNEKFKEYDYEIDRSSEVVNIGVQDQVFNHQDGLNFVNIFKAIFKNNEQPNTPEKPKLKLSQALRMVYDDAFFVSDLQLPKDKIDAFLFYCDEKLPTQELLKKSNEFELIDFLVTQSDQFLNTLNEE